MSEYERITEPGIYPVTCTKVGRKTTKSGNPAIWLLLVTQDGKSIFKTLVSTDASKEYRLKDCKAMGLKRIPTEIEDYVGCQCNIVVNEENGYLNVSAILPYEADTPDLADPPMPDAPMPDDGDVPF